MSEFASEELRHLRPGRDCVVTIGNFDGVHLGHRALVAHVIDRARSMDLAAGVVTLYPDPDRVLRPLVPMRYITSLEERIELLRRLGLDFVAPLNFTSELAELPPATSRARASTCWWPRCTPSKLPIVTTVRPRSSGTSSADRHT